MMYPCLGCAHGLMRRGKTTALNGKSLSAYSAVQRAGGVPAAVGGGLRARHSPRLRPAHAQGHAARPVAALVRRAPNQGPPGSRAPGAATQNTHAHTVNNHRPANNHSNYRSARVGLSKTGTRTSAAPSGPPHHVSCIRPLSPSACRATPCAAAVSAYRWAISFFRRDLSCCLPWRRVGTLWVGSSALGTIAWADWDCARATGVQQLHS